MDGIEFYVLIFAGLLLALVGWMRTSNLEQAALPMLIAGFIELFTLTATNKDGFIVTRVQQITNVTGSFGVPVKDPVWPALWLPFLFLFIAWGGLLYKAVTR